MRTTDAKFFTHLTGSHETGGAIKYTPDGEKVRQAFFSNVDRAARALTEKFGRQVSVGISSGHDFGSVGVHLDAKNEQERITPEFAERLMDAAMSLLGEGAVSRGRVILLEDGRFPTQTINCGDTFERSQG